MLRKLAIFMILSIVAVGCSGGMGESTAGSSVQPSGANDFLFTSDSKTGGRKERAVFLDASDSPEESNGEKRTVVRGASLAVRVENLEDAEKKVQTAIKSNGGYEQTLSSTDLAGPDAQLSITAKVPVEKLDQVIASIEGLGTRVAKTISMEDVTENLMAFDAQIAGLRAQEAKLKGKFGKIIGDDQYHLQNVRSEISQIQLQRSGKAKAAAFSTLQLSLRQGAVPGGHDPNWLTEAYGKASGSAMGALQFAATGLLWLVFMSPFYMPFVAGGWLIHRMQKRKVASISQRMASAPTAPPSMQQI
jgi:hypothetical protein